MFKVFKGGKQCAEFNVFIARWHVDIPLRNFLRSTTAESQGKTDHGAGLPELPEAPEWRCPGHAT